MEKLQLHQSPGLSAQSDAVQQKVEAGLNLAANHAASVGGHSKFLLG